MKNNVYALVSEKDVVVCANGKDAKKISFDYTYYNDFDEYVAAVIYDGLNGIDVESVSLSLILGHTYYRYGNQYITKVKSKAKENYKLCNYSTPVSNQLDAGSTQFFEQHTDFEYEGKECERLEDVPLLQKYIKRKSYLNWDLKRVEALKFQLSKLGVAVEAIIPDVHFYNAYSGSYSGNNAIVDFFDSYTEITIFESGRVRNIVKCNFGISDLISHLSDTFGVSYRNGKILASMYGFANVPGRYVHYEISIPIYKEVVKKVKITDISYEIQAVLKKQFAQLYSEFKKYDVESIVMTGMPIVDADVLMQMISNSDCRLAGDVSYAGICESLDVIGKNSYSKIIESESKEEVSPSYATESRNNTVQEKTDNFGIRNRFSGLLDKIKESKLRIEALMTESE